MKQPSEFVFVVDIHCISAAKNFAWQKSLPFILCQVMKSWCLRIPLGLSEELDARWSLEVLQTSSFLVTCTFLMDKTNAVERVIVDQKNFHKPLNMILALPLDFGSANLRQQHEVTNSSNTLMCLLFCIQAEYAAAGCTT